MFLTIKNGLRDGQLAMNAFGAAMNCSILSGISGASSVGQGHLNLPVVATVERYAPYQDFCNRHPLECDLKGKEVVHFNSKLQDLLTATNIAVNTEIHFEFDADQYNEEEYWALPVTGRGDCEDIALEKRVRLVKSGISAGALRLAFVFHKQFLTSHCLLTVETSEGTYVLDSYSNEVSLWHQAPYNFESRERSDGYWDRFDQKGWSYE